VSEHLCFAHKLKEMKQRVSIYIIGLLSSPVKSFSSTNRQAFTSTIMANNMDKQTAKTAKLWDRFADGYSKQPIKDEEAYQKKLKVTQSYFKPTDSVLEFGCGTGSASIIHSPYVQKILATDISPKMIEIAQKKATDAGVTNVEFKQESINKLQLPEQSQNVVLGMSILHLLDNKEEAMRKVHSWLKPGGYFITSTICISDMGTSSQLFMKSVFPVAKFFGMVPSVYCFTKTELKESLKNNGFDIVYEWQPNKDAATFLVGKKK
jgi:ubiquinone/menaquinone biosynthesis C-methylase UbiE